MLTGTDRSDVSGLSSVVALTMETVGRQTGALAAGGLMTTMAGHNELDVVDMPFDTFTLTLQHT